MNIFNKNSFLKKIAITILTVTLLQIFVIKPVRAAESEDVVEFGGKLIKPIFSLFVTMGDGVMQILHSNIMGVDQSLIKIDTDNSIWETIKTVIAVTITVAACIGAIVLSGGVAAFLGGVAILSMLTAVLPGRNMIIKLENEISYVVASTINEEAIPSELYLPAYSYSPEEIFKGNILLFNVNFFRNPIEIKKATHKNDKGNEMLDYYYYEDDDGDDLDTDGNGSDDTKGYVTSNQDSVATLQKNISNWYRALRNICLVLMLSVLVYIGIRMLLSSVASDKAKYLTMLKDWFIGICLLFLMHYIMTFSVTLVDSLTKVIKTSVENKEYYMAVLPKTKKIEDELKEINMLDKCKIPKGEDGYGWPCNLMGYLRIQAQLATSGAQYVGEGIMFIMLVVFTCIFTFTYLKRLLYMAFLTLISPLVALTYCIDKINDGQAQGFNRWLKEYIFNLLIQPMHLLLYYVLVTTAFSTMGKNIIYSIVAIGFMIPAEKLLRSFFGFEKAHTPPVIGPAATMMAATGLTKLLNRGKSLGSKTKGGNGTSGNSNDSVELPSSQRTLFQAGFDEIENGNDDVGNVNIDDNAENEQDGDAILDQYDPDYDPHNDESYQRFANNPETDGAEPQIQREAETPEVETGEQPEHAQRRFFSRVPIPRGIRRRAEAFGDASVARARVRLKNVPARIGMGQHVKGTLKVLAGKGLAGVTVGGATAAAGIAIAAATGDPNNVWKVGTGAAVGGFAVGSSGIDSVVDNYEDIKNSPVYEAAYNQGEYKEDARKDQIKKFKKSEEYEKIRANLKAAYGKDEAKKIIENGELDKYLDNGISDIKAIRAMHDLQRDNGGLSYIDSTEKAIDVYNAGQLIGNTKSMSKKKQNEYTDTFRDTAKERGMNQENANQFAENQMNAIKQLHDKMYNYNTK